MPTYIGVAKFHIIIHNLGGGTGRSPQARILLEIMMSLMPKSSVRRLYGIQVNFCMDVIHNAHLPVVPYSLE